MKKLFIATLAMASMMTMEAQESKVLYEDANAPMLAWSVACQVSADEVKNIKAGDMFEVTVAEVKSDCDWPKFGFEANGESNYPNAFEMWTRRDNMPYVAKYSVTENDLSLLSGGFDIKGDGVRITKVVYTTTEAEELPEGQTLIFNDSDSPMLSWSVACSVPASQVSGLKAGDALQVTVEAVQEGCDWPKFGFEANGNSQYPEAFEMWGEKTFPYVATYYFTEEDVVWMKEGFDVKGDGVKITRIILISESGEGDAEKVLWSGAPTMVSWGEAGPTVEAGKAASIEAGDNLIITVSEISASAQWQKVVCRCADGWEEIFTIELWEEAAAEMPLVKTVTVTSEMLPLLHAGFNFGGEGASIEKVALFKASGVGMTAESDTVSVYSISGACVRKSVKASEATFNLPSGVYIIGGKKILVK